MPSSELCGEPVALYGVAYGDLFDDCTLPKGHDGSHDPSAARTCPRPGCTKVVAVGVFACGPHWFELPLEIRRPISLAWRRVMVGPLVDAVAAHRKATEAAIAWWWANKVKANGATTR